MICRKRRRKRRKKRRKIRRWQKRIKRIIKYVTLFLPSFDTTFPLSHFVTILGSPPIKYVTSRNTPSLKIAWLQYALLYFVKSSLIRIESFLKKLTTY